MLLEHKRIIPSMNSVVLTAIIRKYAIRFTQFKEQINTSKSLKKEVERNFAMTHSSLECWSIFRSSSKFGLYEMDESRDSLFLPHYKNYILSKDKFVKISSTTIDCIVAPLRAKYAGRALATTKTRLFIKSIIKNVKKISQKTFNLN